MPFAAAIACCDRPSTQPAVAGGWRVAIVPSTVSVTAQTHSGTNAVHGLAGCIPQRAADGRNDDRDRVADGEHAGDVRGTSAGELRSGGNASVAVSVIAVVNPTKAAAKRMQSGRNAEDQPEKCREQYRPEDQKRPRAPLQAIGQQEQDDGATICAPLSQARRGRADRPCRGWRDNRRERHWWRNRGCCCCRRRGRAARSADF